MAIYFAGHNSTADRTVCLFLNVLSSSSLQKSGLQDLEKSVK